MKFKQIFFLNFLLVITLIGTVSVINYLYLMSVQNNIQSMTIGNEQEVSSTSHITYKLIELNTLINNILRDYHNQSANNFENEQVIKNALGSIKNEFEQWRKAILTELKIEQNNQENLAGEKKELIKFTQLNIEFTNLTRMINQLFEFSARPVREKISLVHEKIIPPLQQLTTKILDRSNAAQDEFHSESYSVKQSLTAYGWTNLSAVLVIFLLVLIINMLLANYVLKNLDKFTFSMKRMVKGNFDIYIDIKGKSEFAMLATSFNQISKELANTKRSIESIINTMPNMLLVTDANLIIQRVNDRTCKELDFIRKEIIGKSLTDFLQDETFSNDLYNFPHRSVISRKTSLQAKHKRIPVLFSSSQMFLSDQPNYCLVHIAQDIGQLKKMEDELMNTARQAGMADIATSILHNIGNILNSVKTSIAVVEEKVQTNPMEDLSKIVNLIEQHQGNLENFIFVDPKGKTILKYLLTLSEVSINQKKFMAKEIDLLKKHIEHITNIITTQQKMSTSPGLKEITDISELIEDAINLNQTTIKQHNIEVIREFKTINTVIIDRIKLMQVVVNIIKNAFDALSISDTPQKSLKTTIAEKDELNFIIEIRDNGIGILAENLIKIFTHGFTTKKTGHGFGLHSCALAVKEMHGTINVSSEGLGKGTVFTIILPYSPVKMKKQQALQGEEYGEKL